MLICPITIGPSVPRPALWPAGRWAGVTTGAVPWPVTAYPVVVVVAGFEPTTSSSRTTTPASLTELVAFGALGLGR
jgi:hypothetical protein